MTRIALCCTDPGCSWRYFASSVDQAKGLRCPTHPTKTAVQKNRPYFGEAVETPRVGNLPVVDPAGPPPRKRG